MEIVKWITLTGNWEAVTFTRATKTYFVKNFSEGNIFVSFEENDTEDTSIKILQNTGEQIDISPVILQQLNYKSDTIYIKGTGEVEIQQL